MTPDDLRRYLNEVHGCDTLGPESLAAYAALIETLNGTIREAASAKLEPDDEPADYYRMIEDLAQ